MISDIRTGLTDALNSVIDGTKSVGNAFKDMMRQMLRSLAQKSFIQPLVGAITGGATASMATQAAASGSGAILGASGSIAAGASALGSGLYAGAGTALGFGTSASVVGSTATATGAMGSFGMSLGAVAGPLLAVVAIISFFKKKVKELDSGLQGTVTTMDATIESFSKIKTSRFFGLSKKVSTSSKELSEEAAEPFVKAIQEIQMGVMDAAEQFGIAGDVFDNFSYDFKLSLKGLSEEAQSAAIAEEFNKMGDAFASLSGHFETMNELLAAAQQRYDLTTRLLQLQGNGEELLRRHREREMEATHELNRELLQTIYSIEDLQAAAARASQAVAIANQGVADANQAVADATASLRQAIDAEKGRIQASFASLISGLTDRLDVANEAMDKSRSIYEMLSDSLSSRQVGGDDAFSGRRSSSLAFLRGGDFGDEQKLENALDVVAEPSEQLFGSFVDYARDFGRTSAIIDGAKSIARIQLDADEKQVLLLQQQIDNAKASEEAQLAALDRQFEALTNVNSSVLSVKDAIGALGAAMQAQAAATQAQAQAAAVAAAAGAAAAARATAAGSSDVGSVDSGVGSSFSEQFGTGTQHKGYDYASIGSAAELMQAAASVGVQTAGQSGAQIQQAISNASGMAVGLGSSVRAQGFAMGGYHTGGLRMVGERGPELEATGPSRIFSHNQTSGMFKDPDLKEAVNELRREVSGLRSEQRQMSASNAKYVKRNYDINRKWDVDGLPATRT